MIKAVLDTNLLILLVVGGTSRAYIEKHKRLKSFTVKDFDLLTELLFRIESIITTPNVLTETSNLLAQIEEPVRSEIFNTFSKNIKMIEEIYIDSKIASQQKEFTRLGLTDAALLVVLRDSASTLITTDLGLYLAASDRGLKVINFNHYRDANS
jgi:hypothetical protein